MSKSMGSKVWVGALVLGITVASGLAADRDAANYVGMKSCAMCHKKADTGDQFGKWQASPHAKAFEVLGTPEAKAAGAKVGVTDPQKSGKCLKCHSTAYNFSETVATDKITPEEGVTCEACHGPGKTYKSKAVMEDHKKCIENGMVVPATKSCELCHNSGSPTWKGSFNAEQSYEKIKHPDSKVQK